MSSPRVTPTLWMPSMKREVEHSNHYWQRFMHRHRYMHSKLLHYTLEIDVVSCFWFRQETKLSLPEQLDMEYSNQGMF